MDNQQAALIDCRPWAEYVKGHRQGTCSLPAEQLFPRMHELPLRTQPLILYGDEQDLKLANSWLLDRGHTVQQQILWSTDLEQQLRQEGKLETGEQSAQLWQAAPLWQRFVTEIMPKHQVQPGVGVDIACGAGRDMVYLAQHNWEMTGIDRSEEALQRTTSLAEHSKVPIKTLQLDLENGQNVLSGLPEQSLDLITVARYLHRPLFPDLKHLLRPGGIMIYQTFFQGCQNTRIGRPGNPNFLLRPGELAEIFSGFDIWLDEVEVLADGRPVSAFIAAKN